MRTLIIGSGFAGRALAQRITDAGGEAVLASRRRPHHLGIGTGRPPTWTRLDVTDRDACQRTLRQTGADAVVLVHGPSDVTWCEAHPAKALSGHVTAARHIAQLLDGRRVVLVSTDNVFDGAAPRRDEDAETAPANAYGRAKLAAEQALREVPNATVLRVSLIYGWEPADGVKWLNFFASCAHRLRAGQPVTAPMDQWTTPVLLADMSAVTAAVVTGRGPPLLHLGGPDRVSRAAWAAIIAQQMGAPGDLVVPEPRAAGRYADRPANTGLSSRLLATHPITAGIPVRGVREGTRLLLDWMAQLPGARL